MDIPQKRIAPHTITQARDHNSSRDVSQVFFKGFDRGMM
jgi:hypothetical protein